MDLTSKNFVNVKDGSFFLLNKPFRFIGVNMYELAYVDSAVSQMMLRDAAGQGFRAVRFWAFEPVNNDNFREICNHSHELGLKIIPVLADPNGYLQNYKIENEWYQKGYKNNYIKYATDLVSRFKDRDEILLWELINEPVTDSFEDIYNFTKDASEMIRSADQNHLISIGTIGGIGDKFGNFFSRFNHKNFETLYSIRTLDAVSIHDYSFGSTLFERLDILYRLKGKYKNSRLSSSINKIIDFLPAKIDNLTLNKFNKTFDFPSTLRSIWRNYNKKNITAAKKLNKPLYVGETGFKKELGDLRKKVLERELRSYFNEGVAGVLLWSFESQGRSLDGHDYGFNTEDEFGEIVKKLNIE